MANETDIQNLWQKQSSDSPRVSLEEIRARAQRFDERSRRWGTFGKPFFILLIVGTSVEVVWPGFGPVERTGDLLTVAAFLYAAYEYRKHDRPVSRPEGLGQTTCIQFYRTQLVRERNLAGRSRRYLLPFVPGVMLS